MRDYIKFLVKEQPPPTPYIGQKLTTDGRVIDVMVAWNYKRQHGWLTGFTSVITDITEQKRAEDSLRKSEQRFDLVVKGANDGIWDLDIATGKSWWSPRLYELLGHEVEGIEAGLETFKSILHPDDRAHMFEALRAHLEDRVPYDIEYRLRTKFRGQRDS